jgi:hypothetical protein
MKLFSAKAKVILGATCCIGPVYKTATGLFVRKDGFWIEVRPLHNVSLVNPGKGLPVFWQEGGVQ